jgi:hypothetical protein
LGAEPTSLIRREHLKDIEVGTIDFLLSFVPSGGHLSQNLFNIFDDALDKLKRRTVGHKEGPNGGLFND